MFELIEKIKRLGELEEDAFCRYRDSQRMDADFADYLAARKRLGAERDMLFGRIDELKASGCE